MPSLFSSILAEDSDEVVDMLQVKVTMPNTSQSDYILTPASQRSNKSYISQRL